jgi:hypothetical protein
VGVYRHLQNGDTTERSKKLKDHHMAGKIIIYPPALFEVYEIGKNANFLLPLIYKKKPMRRNLFINLQSHIHNMLCVVELCA